MHRTWYQCVSGSTGEVESTTSRVAPGKEQSNHNAMPWIWAIAGMVNCSGTSKRCSASMVMVVKSKRLVTAAALIVCGAT